MLSLLHSLFQNLDSSALSQTSVLNRSLVCFCDAATEEENESFAGVVAAQCKQGLLPSPSPAPCFITIPLCLYHSLYIHELCCLVVQTDKASIDAGRDH